jgi:putative transposase
MPRRARVIIPNTPHHITHRSNSRDTIFEAPSDFFHYLKLMGKACKREPIDLIAFCIMSNHVHLILTPHQPAGLSRFMATVQQGYAKYFNATRFREGHLWKERFYSCPIDESWLDCAFQYVIDNPVRAGIVKKPEEYLWSNLNKSLFKKGGLIRIQPQTPAQNRRKFNDEGIEEFRKMTRGGRLFEGTECHVT